MWQRSIHTRVLRVKISVVSVRSVSLVLLVQREKAAQSDHVVMIAHHREVGIEEIVLAVVVSALAQAVIAVKTPLCVKISLLSRPHLRRLFLRGHIQKPSKSSAYLTPSWPPFVKVATKSQPPFRSARFRSFLNPEMSLVLLRPALVKQPLSPCLL